MKDIQIIDDGESRERKKKFVKTYTATTSSGSSDSTDYEIFMDSLSSLEHNTAISKDTLKSALANLEVLSHDLEYGIKLVNPKPLSQFLQFLRVHPDPTIRQSSARIIGSSLLNNPDSHSLIKRQSLLEQLISLLETEEDNAVRASLVFTLNAATMDTEDVQELMQYRGLEILRSVYGIGDSDVRGKCATFVEDKLLVHRSIPLIDIELSQWCKLFQQSLISNNLRDNLTSQKLLSSLMYQSI